MTLLIVVSFRKTFHPFHVGNSRAISRSIRSSRYLASSSVRKISISWNRYFTVPRSGSHCDHYLHVNHTAIDQRFESTAKAAILMTPDGATTWDLRHLRRFRRIISCNAQDWYKHARITRGREVRNGEIRLVDKVSSWGIATSACNTGQTASYVFKRDPTHLYKWDCVGGSGRVGPQKREIGDLIKDNVFLKSKAFLSAR